MLQLFSIISAVLFFISYYFYIRSIFSKETKPQKVSWLIWAITDILILITLFLQKVSNFHISLAATIGSVFIAFLAFRYGTKGWTKTDIICLVLSIVGIILWFFFNNPLIALIILSLTQIIASIPTIIHLWHKPKDENLLSWGLFFVSAVFGILAIPVFKPENYVFQLALLLVSFNFWIIFFRRKNH
jgi:hypothetical protein